MAVGSDDDATVAVMMPAAFVTVTAMVATMMEPVAVHLPSLEALASTKLSAPDFSALAFHKGKAIVDGGRMGKGNWAQPRGGRPSGCRV